MHIITRLGKDQLMLKPRNTELSPPRLLLATEKEVATALRLTSDWCCSARVSAGDAKGLTYHPWQSIPVKGVQTESQHRHPWLSLGRLGVHLGAGAARQVWQVEGRDAHPMNIPKHRTVPTRENGQQHQAGKPSSRPDLQLIGNAQDGGTRATRRSWKHWNKQKVLLR